MKCKTKEESMKRAATGAVANRQASSCSIKVNTTGIFFRQRTSWKSNNTRSHDGRICCWYKFPFWFLLLLHLHRPAQNIITQIKKDPIKIRMCHARRKDKHDVHENTNTNEERIPEWERVIERHKNRVQRSANEKLSRSGRRSTHFSETVGIKIQRSQLMLPVGLQIWFSLRFFQKCLLRSHVQEWRQ